MVAVARLVLRKHCRTWSRKIGTMDPESLRHHFEMQPTTIAGTFLATFLRINLRCFHIHPLLPHHLDTRDSTAWYVITLARGLARLIQWIGNNPIGECHVILLRRVAHMYKTMYREWSRQDRSRMMNQLAKMRYECTMAVRAIEASEDVLSTETKQWLAGQAARLERIDETAMRVGGRSWLRKIRQWTPERIPVLNDLRDIHATCRRALFDTLRDDLKQRPPRVDRYKQNLVELLRSIMSLLKESQQLAFERTIDAEHIANSLKNGTFDVTDTCDLAKMLDYWIVTLQCPAEDASNQSWLRSFLHKVQECKFMSVAEALVELLSHNVNRMSRMIQRIRDAAK